MNVDALMATLSRARVKAFQLFIVVYYEAMMMIMTVRRW
jgi:hypothetical protein